MRSPTGSFELEADNGFFNQRDFFQCIENLEAADQTLVEANPEEALMHLV
jgi:hypothetical protein